MRRFANLNEAWEDLLNNAFSMQELRETPDLMALLKSAFFAGSTAAMLVIEESIESEDIEQIRLKSVDVHAEIFESFDSLKGLTSTSLN